MKPITIAILLLCAIGVWSGNDCLADPVGGVSLGGYPSRPLRWVVATSAGGGSDTVARLFAQQFTEVLGQQVVIDNRPGAAGKIGLGIVANAAPDGYTMGLITITDLLSTSLSNGRAPDLDKEFSPVSLLATVPIILVVHPSLNARTLQEFVSLARNQPGKINYGSGGIGAVQHVTTELLKHEAKIDLLHVPYKGAGPALIDLRAGRIQVFMTSIANVLAYMRSGQLRPLAISSLKRSPQAPDVPTFSELGMPGMTASIWYGIVVPLRTLPAIVEKLSTTAAMIVRMPDLQQRMLAQGAEPASSTPAAFRGFLRNEEKRWKKVVLEANIRIH